MSLQKAAHIAQKLLVLRVESTLVPRYYNPDAQEPALLLTYQLAYLGCLKVLSVSLRLAYA